MKIRRRRGCHRIGRRSVRHPEIPWQIVPNDSVNLLILTARHFYVISPHLVQTFFSVDWSAKKTRAKKFFQSLFYGRNELAVHQQTRQHFARAVARVAGRAREAVGEVVDEDDLAGKGALDPVPDLRRLLERTCRAAAQCCRVDLCLHLPLRSRLGAGYWPLSMPSGPF